MITQVGKGGVIRPTVVLEEDLVDFEGRAEVAEELAEFTESLLDTRIPIGRTINNIPLDQDIVLTPEILGTYDRATIDQKIDTAESSGYVPVKVNGHLLDTNVNLTAADLDAYSAQEIDDRLNFVPGTRTVNGKPLSADVTLAPGDVGAPTKTSVDATAAAIVPVTRKVNGKALSADIELVPGDIGAPAVDDVVPRTFTINGQPMVGTEMTVTLDAEAYTKVEIDTKLRNYIPLANNWGLGTAPKVDQTIDASGFHAYTTAAPNHPTGSEKGTVAAIVSDSKTYALAFPEDQTSPQYFNGTWRAVGGGVKAPIPDVWLPLEDSLRMITGEGPYDTVTINGSSLDLNTKSAAFTRASTATYIGKDGVLKTAVANEPRFEREGLLIEGQATNFILNSNPFNSPWHTNNLVSNPVFTDMGDGTAKISAGPLDGRYYYDTDFLTRPVPGRTYVLSAWLKILSGKVTIGWEKEATLDLNLSDAAELTRVSIPYTFPAGGTTWPPIILYSLETPSEYIVGRVQVEEGTVMTSFIPTTGSEATRAGDLCSIQTPGNFPGKDFTLAMNASFRAGAATPVRRKLFSATAFYTIGFEGVDPRVPTDTGGRAFVYMGQQDDSQYTGLDPLSIHSFDQTKPLVVVVDPNSRVSVHNGKAIPPVQITPTIAPGSNFFIGSDPGEWSGAHLNGHIRNVRIWLNPLPEEQIGALV